MWKRGVTMAIVAAALAGPALAESARIGRPAPELTAGAWVNSRPLTMAGLRGRVVLVEFWTFG